MKIRLVLGKGRAEDRKAIDAFRKELERRVRVFKGFAASEAVRYLQPLNNEEDAERHFHTGYFRANWKVSINSPDFSLRLTTRQWELDPKTNYMQYAGDVKAARQENMDSIDAHTRDEKKINAPIFVSNGVWYGKWLRDGADPNDILSSELTGGQAQEAQMQGQQGNGFEDFQRQLENDFKNSYDWDKIMRWIANSGADKMPADMHIGKYK